MNCGVIDAPGFGIIYTPLFGVIWTPFFGDIVDIPAVPIVECGNVPTPGLGEIPGVPVIDLGDINSPGYGDSDAIYRWTRLTGPRRDSEYSHSKLRQHSI